MTIPPEAVDLATVAVHDVDCPDRDCNGSALGHACKLACAALEAAAPLIAAAERDRLYAELGNDHYVIYTEDRWTVEHSVECRLSGQMPECAYHEAVAAVSDEFEPAMVGRWLICNIDTEGVPVLERAAVALIEGDKP